MEGELEPTKAPLTEETVAVLSADEFGDLLRLVRTGATTIETRSFS